MISLKKTENWKTAYLDSTQQLLVNTETPQGKDLIDMILQGEAVFPDIYSKAITTSTAIIENKDRQRTKDLYPMVKEAFEKRPNPSLTLAMIQVARRIPGLRQKIAVDLQAYVDAFLQQQEDYQQQDGYGLRLASAEIAAHFLSQLNPKEKKRFVDLATTFRENSKSLSNDRIW